MPLDCWLAPRLGVIGTNAAILSGVGGLIPPQVHLNGVQLVKVSWTSPEKAFMVWISKTEGGTASTIG